jgi:hypothetical protein
MRRSNFLGKTRFKAIISKKQEGNRIDRLCQSSYKKGALERYPPFSPAPRYSAKNAILKKKKAILIP